MDLQGAPDSWLLFVQLIRAVSSAYTPQTARLQANEQLHALMNDMASSSPTHALGLLEYLCMSVCPCVDAIDSYEAFYVAKSLQLYVWKGSDQTVHVVHAVLSTLTSSVNSLPAFVRRQFEKVLSDASRTSLAQPNDTSNSDSLAEYVLQALVNLSLETPLVGARLLPNLLEEMMIDDRRLGYDEQELVTNWTFEKIMSLSEHIVNLTRQSLNELYAKSMTHHQELLLAIITGCLNTLHLLASGANRASLLHSRVHTNLPQHALTLLFDIIDASILENVAQHPSSDTFRLPFRVGLICVETMSDIVRQRYAPSQLGTSPQSESLVLVANIAQRATQILSAVTHHATNEGVEDSEAVSVGLVELVEGFVTVHLVRFVNESDHDAHGVGRTILRELMSSLVQAGKATITRLRIQTALAKVWSAIMDLEEYLSPQMAECTESMVAAMEQLLRSALYVTNADGLAEATTEVETESTTLKAGDTDTQAADADSDAEFDAEECAAHNSSPLRTALVCTDNTETDGCGSNIASHISSVRVALIKMCRMKECQQWLSGAIQATLSEVLQTLATQKADDDGSPFDACVLISLLSLACTDTDTLIYNLTSLVTVVKDMIMQRVYARGETPQLLINLSLDVSSTLLAAFPEALQLERLDRTNAVVDAISEAVIVSLDTAIAPAPFGLMLAAAAMLKTTIRSVSRDILDLNHSIQQLLSQIPESFTRPTLPLPIQTQLYLAASDAAFPIRQTHAVHVDSGRFVMLVQPLSLALSELGDLLASSASSVTTYHINRAERASALLAALVNQRRKCSKTVKQLVLETLWSPVQALPRLVALLFQTAPLKPAAVTVARCVLALLTSLARTLDKQLGIEVCISSIGITLEYVVRQTRSFVSGTSNRNHHALIKHCATILRVVCSWAMGESQAHECVRAGINLTSLIAQVQEMGQSLSTSALSHVAEGDTDVESELLRERIKVGCTLMDKYWIIAVEADGVVQDFFTSVNVALTSDTADPSTVLCALRSLETLGTNHSLWIQAWFEQLYWSGLSELLLQSYLSSDSTVVLFEELVTSVLYQMWNINHTILGRAVALISDTIARHLHLQLQLSRSNGNMHQFAQQVHNRCMSYWEEALAHSELQPQQQQLDLASFRHLLSKCARNCTAATLQWHQGMGMEGPVPQSRS